VGWLPRFSDKVVVIITTTDTPTSSASTTLSSTAPAAHGAAAHARQTRHHRSELSNLLAQPRHLYTHTRVTRRVRPEHGPNAVVDLTLVIKGHKRHSAVQTTAGRRWTPCTEGCAFHLHDFFPSFAMPCFVLQLAMPLIALVELGKHLWIVQGRKERRSELQ